MTGRATFGDFARAASQHLQAQVTPAAMRQNPAAVAAEVQELTRGLDQVLTVMDRYLADIAATSGAVSGKEPRPVSPWARASTEAHAALRNARGYLAETRNPIAWRSRTRVTGSAARELHAAAASLAAGRDLLHTHFLTDSAGTRHSRSEWAPVITSASLTQALLTELAGWARQLAPRGAQPALPRARLTSEIAEDQLRLNAACQWLRALASAVENAQRQDPVRADDMQQLHAVPANILPPRRLPAGTETMTGLSQGTTGSAERVRHAARTAVPTAAWSPCMTAESLSQAAACATIISHHCEIIQQALAVRAAQHGSPSSAQACTPRPRLPHTPGWHGSAPPAPGTTSRQTPTARSRQRQPKPPTSRCGPGASPTPTPAGPRT